MGVHNDMHRNYKKQTVPPIFVVGVVVVVIVAVILMAVLGAFGKKGNESASSLISVEIESKDIHYLGETLQSSDVASTESTVTSDKPTSSNKSSSSSKPTYSSSSAPSQIVNAYVPKGDWRLIIANKQYPLPESYKVNVSYVSGNYRLDSRIADAYKEMIAAAKKDGVSLNIISGFRTFSGQTSLFNNKVNQYRNQGYSTEKAKELAAQYVAPPGTSEHLTGLAVDLISPTWYNTHSSLTSDFENTEQFKWLYANCAKYGFILRYPKDKVNITGYNYEPWHYRYVGVEAAKEIMEKKICLEEYVAGLN